MDDQIQQTHTIHPLNAKSGYSGGSMKSKHRLVSMGICVGEFVFLFSFSSRINFVVSTFAYLSIHLNVHSFFLPAAATFFVYFSFYFRFFFIPCVIFHVQKKIYLSSSCHNAGHFFEFLMQNNLHKFLFLLSSSLVVFDMYTWIRHENAKII